MQWLERFERYFEKRDKGCWEWKGPMSAGLPVFNYRGSKHQPQRFSWRAYKTEDLPEGGRIYRSCRNVLCVNPEHLHDGSEESRFWSKVSRLGPDECWEWRASRIYGDMPYGRFSRPGGKHVYAHRYSYELHHGPIPERQLVLHRCDNPGCVNPAHLFVGTHQDNVDDMESKGRAHREWGNKLTEQNVIDIRNRYSLGGIIMKDLAQEYGVSMVTIISIVKRRTWRHI